MKSLKNVFILGLALTTTVGAIVSWQQHLELISLRAAALTSGDALADWQKRFQAAEKSRADLEAKSVTRRADADDSVDPAASDEPTATQRGRFDGGRNRFARLMDQPEAQKLIALQQKAALDSRYASLFKNLNLTPAQLDQFKNLLVEKQTAMRDVMQAAREQGLNPRTDRDAFQSLVSSTEADIDSSIRSTLGDAGFAQYEQYQQTLPQRNITAQLQQSLSYTGTPLTDAQSDQLVQILAANSPAPQNPNGMGPFGGGPNGPIGRITDAAVIQAQGVLSAPQLQALQQLQQTQQAQEQLRRLFRSGATTPATSAPTAPAPTASGG